MKTYEEVLTEIKTEMAVSNLDTSEGSYCDTICRAAAYALANCYFDMESLVPIVFIDETSGPYIDKKANLFGVSRTPGAKATATAVLVGSGTISPGVALQTVHSLIFYTTESAALTADGVTVALEAAEDGTLYNGETVVSAVSNVGVGVQSSQPAAGGVARESDESLVVRLKALWRKPPTSGNAYHYEQWALAVNGIGGAKIYPAWDGGGTVKIVLVDDDGAPPTESQVDDVAEYVETQRPICVDVTVVAATALTLNFAAEVVVTSATTVDQVMTDWTGLLVDYLRSLSFADAPLVYNRALFMLLSVPGVADVVDMTVNDGIENITFDSGEVPVLGTVEVTE